MERAPDNEVTGTRHRAQMPTNTSHPPVSTPLSVDDTAMNHADEPNLNHSRDGRQLTLGEFPCLTHGCSPPSRSRPAADSASYPFWKHDWPPTFATLLTSNLLMHIWPYIAIAFLIAVAAHQHINLHDLHGVVAHQQMMLHSLDKTVAVLEERSNEIYFKMKRAEDEWAKQTTGVSTGSYLYSEAYETVKIIFSIFKSFFKPF